jgi:hypothetical protein
VLAWAALLVAIAVSFRPAVPIIWGDTPSFVESALRTLEAGRPTVAGGRDPGYPAFLAMTFAFGGAGGMDGDGAISADIKSGQGLDSFFLLFVGGRAKLTPYLPAHPEQQNAAREQQADKF